MADDDQLSPTTGVVGAGVSSRPASSSSAMAIEATCLQAGATCAPYPLAWRLALLPLMRFSRAPAPGFGHTNTHPLAQEIAFTRQILSIFVSSIIVFYAS